VTWRLNEGHRANVVPVNILNPIPGTPLKKRAAARVEF